MRKNPSAPRTTPALFGAGVRRVRLRKGISQDALSVDAGVSQSAISAVEGEAPDVRLSTAWRLANALNTTINNLIKQGGVSAN